MNVHAAALAKAHRFDEQTSAFARDVIDGLSQHPKRLSPKYFYDAAGLSNTITLDTKAFTSRMCVRPRALDMARKSSAV